ncbi:enoyl-CoA hydratase/isomerase family protein [Kibdelosporangium phytohabitans]|uniref:Enoyl-CoA hydratase n=1 Tax=Kibdelosporangium phytohabitans TaxID=860235 RepID=A0A0N7F3J5_9PSEU|nr:enoyl-CoA hydratase/isomerase family protein [Kibdelosporangium phytohabitans]ALG08807.1 enoyl-CoA hydratase [Kibdelosporangium phytohabitans]MBE1470053.1 enoyl-CoA hydratase/carnithine racemase [Kibdelosporangium phytohabitans]
MVVDYECRDRVARVHLNRPDRLNAVTTELTEGLLTALDQAAGDSARAVVLAGRGRAFCSGHDLKEPVPVETAIETARRVERLQEVTRRIRAFPGVVIAAVHGYAVGAGCEFALCCDLVIADEHAQFGFPEVGLGLSVTGGISALLPKIAGPAVAKEMLLLGERFPAARAAELGLVNRVVPAGEHEKAALDWAATVANRPPVAVSLAKQVLNQGMDGGMTEALATEVGHAVLTSVAGEYGNG